MCACMCVCVFFLNDECEVAAVCIYPTGIGFSSSSRAGEVML